MAVSLEKIRPNESENDEAGYGESSASPEVQGVIAEIETIEARLDAALDITPGTKESTEATDAFLVDAAERADASLDDFETAVIAGALEASGERTLGSNNPIPILEIDGYGANIDDVVRELNERHATLPNGEQAAEVTVREIEELKNRENIAGEVSFDGKVVAQEAQVSTGIPEFDQLDDYTPEFSGQILMHRSNAELNEGDIVLPSDQISPELYEELNGERSFSSGSDPRKGEYAAGTDGYDRKLVHAGTRDYGEVYGKYLYVVEPLEGDTLKWGENFGVDISRKQRVKSPAFGGIRTSRMQPATTDSHTGKWHNEVVSTRGFRVVKRISHEPEYSEALLPWPVGPDAMAKREARNGNKDSNVALSRGDTEPGYGTLTFPVRTTSRKRPGKRGAMNSKGTYRAGADEQIPANLRTRFDVRKQHIENPGQSAFPGMSISKYGDPDRWKPTDLPIPHSEQGEQDTPLPGMEDIKPSFPQV